MKFHRILFTIAAAVAANLALPAPAKASAAAPVQGDSRPALPDYNLEKGLALKGYDPVAYFAEGGGKPAKGKASLEAEHRGVKYRFANEANRDRFLASPGRFEPAYGGWCAYAMSGGDKVEVDPRSFLVDDSQLLVFYKGFLNDTRKKWQKQGSAKLRPKADANWQRLSGEGAARDTSHFNLDAGLALGGYDPVAYRSGKAVKGEERLSSRHEGVAYRFATADSRQAFQAAPATFEPRYGGWCAWAMAQGKKVPVDVEAFVRDEEGLFLFYNKDKRDEWIAGRQQMKADGDRHWERITGA